MIERIEKNRKNSCQKNREFAGWIRRKIPFGLSFILVFFLTAPAFAALSIAEESYQSVESESSFYEVLKRYEAIVKKYPESKFASLSQRRIAEQYFILGNFRQARLQWKKYLKLFPEGDDAQRAYLAIGACFYKEKRTAQAIANFKEFINLYPDSPFIEQAYFNLASVYLNRGKIDQAKIALEGILRDYPDWENKALVYKRLSEVYLEEGEDKKSAEILKEIKRDFPEAIGTGKEKDKRGVYTIQVGAFSDKEKADKLAARFRQKGYDVYISPGIKKRTTFYRVRIGSFAAEEEARRKAEAIKKKEKIPVMVVK